MKQFLVGAMHCSRTFKKLPFKISPLQGTLKCTLKSVQLATCHFVL